ncbi:MULTISPECIES: transposase family protein [Methylosinus]|uniref:transposase family protein n=1 Tax=Methylosinus TaxID=425 RepID=UPI00163D7DF6|nr:MULTISPECIES: transposase family protein [Methylosinus]MBU3889418.1 transposase family protein [Methylosinus sp. KRF6]
MDWLRGYLPFENGVATTQTLRKVFRLLDPKALERGFAAWTASVRPLAREVVAVDGKTRRGSRQSDGTGALQRPTPPAPAQRAVDGKPPASAAVVVADRARARLSARSVLGCGARA